MLPQELICNHILRKVWCKIYIRVEDGHMRWGLLTEITIYNEKIYYNFYMKCKLCKILSCSYVLTKLILKTNVLTSLFVWKVYSTNDLLTHSEVQMFQRVVSITRMYSKNSIPASFKSIKNNLQELPHISDSTKFFINQKFGHEYLENT